MTRTNQHDNLDRLTNLVWKVGSTTVANYTWSMEDCAVCRQTLADGTTKDRVLGCITFNFVRHIDGTADLDSGFIVIVAAAKKPTSLWGAAMQNWKGRTDK